MSELTQRNKEIFAAALHGKANVQVATDFGLSRERIRQILNKAIRCVTRRISEEDKATFPKKFQELMTLDTPGSYSLWDAEITIKDMRDDPEFWFKRFVDRRWAFWHFIAGPKTGPKVIPVPDSPEDNLSNLNLTVRSMNNLVATGIKDIHTLVTKTEMDLLSSHNMFGRKSVNEIKESLAGIGLTLREPEVPDSILFKELETDKVAQVEPSNKVIPDFYLTDDNAAVAYIESRENEGLDFVGGLTWITSATLPHCIEANFQIDGTDLRIIHELQPGTLLMPHLVWGVLYDISDENKRPVTFVTFNNFLAYMLAKYW